ncbi:MAG: hypothetical protein R3A13_11200 [Bdellovibrionota bacterium]
MRICCYFIIFSILFSEFWAQSAEAERRRPPLRTKRAVRDLSDFNDDSNSLNFSSTFQRIIISPAVDFDIYDPITIENFKRLRDTSKPIWNEDNYDAEDMQRASQKALTMQAGRVLSETLNRSELQNALS